MLYLWKTGISPPLKDLKRIKRDTLCICGHNMYNDQRIVCIKPMLPLYGSSYDLVDLNYMNPPVALMLHGHHCLSCIMFAVTY